MIVESLVWYPRVSLPDAMFNAALMVWYALAVWRSALEYTTNATISSTHSRTAAKKTVSESERAPEILESATSDVAAKRHGVVDTGWVDVYRVT